MIEFLRRLKQRKLVQWTAAYVAASFAVIQAVDIVSQRFGWPEAAMRFLIVALAIGVLLVLVLAWYHGERGAQRVTAVELSILGLLLAIGGGVLWGIAPKREAHDQAQADKTPATIAIPPAADVDGKSIAVLPLANESGEQGQQYFSDGLSEDLITALAQFGTLKVISRNSSFQFRDSTDDARTIGAKLGVAHLLEGSVRRAGDAVRVRTELVSAADGRTLWSQHFDRPYRDLFALQDEITQAVAQALRAKLVTAISGTKQSEHPPSGNLDAYNAYLQGRFHTSSGPASAQWLGIDDFNEAVRIDPAYARAYAALAMVWCGLGQSTLAGAEKQHAYEQAQIAADRAIALDPDLAAAHVARGFLLQSKQLDWAGAEAEYQRAVALAPDDTLARVQLAMLTGTRGQLQKAVELTRQALVVDPRRAAAFNFLGRFLTALGRYDEAEQAIRQSIELRSGNAAAYVGLTTLAILRKDPASALREALGMAPGNWRTIALALARQVGDDAAAADAALQALIDQQGDDSAVQIAEVYALRKEPDRMFEWLDRAYAARDPGIQLLLFDTYLLQYKTDARFAAFCTKVNLPTPT
ncbi:MAG: tetratricopeptide repeat protein [Dokdonella sp.]